MRIHGRMRIRKCRGAEGVPVKVVIESAELVDGVAAEEVVVHGVVVWVTDDGSG